MYQESLWLKWLVSPGTVPVRRHVLFLSTGLYGDHFALLYKFQRKVLRFMDAYRKGASGRWTAFAVRKYRGQRAMHSTKLDGRYRSGVRDKEECTKTELARSPTIAIVSS